ncbi:unnamed protein product, partial [Prorocentrum cordatum]
AMLELRQQGNFGWSAVKGPTGAAIMTLDRFGWTPESYRARRLQSGLAVDLEAVRRVSLKQFACDDLRRQGKGLQ